MAGPGQPEGILLDACCVLNLYASRRMGEMLRSLGRQIGIAEAAAGESLYVEVAGGAGPLGREPVDLQPLISAGLLEVLNIDSDNELAAYVSFASLVDDGEAMTFALAVHRHYVVATDDRRARSVLREFAPQVPLLSTSEIIKRWSDSERIPPAVLKQVLTDVQQRARFTPGRHDPLVQWWSSIMADPPD